MKFEEEPDYNFLLKLLMQCENNKTVRLEN